MCCFKATGWIKLFSHHNSLLCPQTDPPCFVPYNHICWRQKYLFIWAPTEWCPSRFTGHVFDHKLLRFVFPRSWTLFCLWNATGFPQVPPDLHLHDKTLLKKRFLHRKMVVVRQILSFNPNVSQFSPPWCFSSIPRRSLFMFHINISHLSAHQHTCRPSTLNRLQYLSLLTILLAKLFHVLSGKMYRPSHRLRHFVSTCWFSVELFFRFIIFSPALLPEHTQQQLQ